jgi:hypothetical protein
VDLKESMNTQAVSTLPADYPIEAKQRIFTVQEAAQLLRRKPNWLYTKTKQKSIPHRRFGKYIVFTETDIEAIIAMSQRGPGNSPNVRMPEGQS